jgi:hypothetical protein
MTTETDTAQLLAEMQSTLARQAAEIAELRQRPAGDAEDALARAVREFAAQYESDVPGARMQGPCVRLTREGQPCGRPWAHHLPDDNGRPAIVSGHSYLERDLTPGPGPRRGFYRRDDAEPVTVEAVAAETLADTYMTEKDAAARLAVTVPALRGMVKAGTVKSDRVGAVTLVRRQSVERIAETAALAAEDGALDG